MKLHIFLGVFAATMLFAEEVIGDIPKQMNFQGILSGSIGSPLADSTVEVEFRIYDTAAGGSFVWSEIVTLTTDNDGQFNVILGLISPIEDTVFGRADRYLSINVESSGEIIPRTKITSVGYSNRVSTVDGAAGGTISGNLEVNNGQIKFPGNTRRGIYTPFNDDTSDVYGMEQLSVFQTGDEAALRIFTATGTNKYISFGRYTGFTSFNEFMRITQEGNVGIGTPNPTSKVDIVGDLEVSGNIIGSTPWTDLPLAVGYNNYVDAHGGGWQKVQYRKIGDMVYLRGAVHKADHANIPVGAIIGTLPVGFRPPARVRFFTDPGLNDILPNGDVYVHNSVVASEAHFHDGTSFSTSP